MKKIQQQSTSLSSLLTQYFLFVLFVQETVVVLQGFLCAKLSCLLARASYLTVTYEGGVDLISLSARKLIKAYFSKGQTIPLQ